MPTVTRRLSIVAVAVIVAFTAPTLGAVRSTDADLPGPRSSDGPGEAAEFVTVDAFATKTGFRAVVVWAADQPVDARVEYGTDPANLDRTVRSLSGPGNGQMAVLEDLDVGEEYHYRVVDEVTGASSEVRSFVAENAYNRRRDAGPHGDVYEINLLVQIDSEALPDEVPFDAGLVDVARAVDLMAERLWDATDGYVRVDDVLVTDTAPGQPTVPFGGAPCVRTGSGQAHTVADVVYESAPPLDSHTFSRAISDPCLGIYMGRLGQLVVPWGNIDAPGFKDLGPPDAHNGYTLVHELAHYAFGADDLYPLASDADCVNEDYDISLMHNSGGFRDGAWRLTEFDRDPRTTPCDHGSQDWTWDELTKDYTAIPEADPGSSTATPTLQTGPLSDTVVRGHPDGGTLTIRVLDSTTGLLSKCDPNPAPDEHITCKTVAGPV